MRTYDELGHVHRNEPCVEYPGKWLVYANGADVDAFDTFAEAYQIAVELQNNEEEHNVTFSICWKCSDNDPRVGKTWFTGFYQHGKFNQFGAYKS
jgi:hypothetical protein